ncbi:hypothetical protein BH10PSE2_BH10PSE2_30310 [soil metagenome]
MSVQFTQACYVLAVHDVEASQQHYVDSLAFEPLDIDAPGWRFVSRGPVRIDMGECTGAIPPGDLGDHNWFARIFVDDLDAYALEISGRGADVIAYPADKPWGLREMVVRTPDGHRLMFCQALSSRP